MNNVTKAKAKTLKRQANKQKELVTHEWQKDGRKKETTRRKPSLPIHQDTPDTAEVAAAEAAEASAAEDEIMIISWEAQKNWSKRGAVNTEWQGINVVPMLDLHIHQQEEGRPCIR